MAKGNQVGAVQRMAKRGGRRSGLVMEREESYKEFSEEPNHTLYFWGHRSSGKGRDKGR